MNSRAMRAPHAIPSRFCAATFSFILEPGSRRLVRLLLGGVTVILLATAAAALVSPVGTFNPNFKANVAVGKAADTSAGMVPDAPAGPDAAAGTLVDSLSAVDAPAPADVRTYADARPIVSANLAGTVRVNNLA